MQIALDGRGKFDLTAIAADSFGNALGNSIVGAIQLQGEKNKLGPAGKDQYDYAIGQGKTPQQALEVARFADEQDMRRFFAGGSGIGAASGDEPIITTTALGERFDPGAPTPIAPEPLTAAQREQVGQFAALDIRAGERQLAGEIFAPINAANEATQFAPLVGFNINFAF